MGRFRYDICRGIPKSRHKQVVNGGRMCSCVLPFLTIDWWGCFSQSSACVFAVSFVVRFTYDVCSGTPKNERTVVMRLFEVEFEGSDEEGCN